LLGRDKVLLRESCSYAEAVFSSAAMISVLPHWMRPILGPVLSHGAQKHLAVLRENLLPCVKERLSKLTDEPEPEVRVDMSHMR